MTDLREISYTTVDLDGLADFEGHIAVFVPEAGTLSPGARRMGRLLRGTIARVVESEDWAKRKEGDVTTLAFPSGVKAQAVHVVRLSRRPSLADARVAGAALAKAVGDKPALILAENITNPAEIGFALALRSYAYTSQKSEPSETPSAVQIACKDPEAVAAAAADKQSVAEGVVFTRDLVSAPANVLTTVTFAGALEGLRALGVEVEVLEEEALAELGMTLLLSVGQGSVSPSKVVVMRWKGADTAPLALIGKGVVFDTGGISLKPAAGMEDMTMDMGGAGVVAGVMKAVAHRKAAAHVIGMVGLVENMPSGEATRPGDIVRSMKGDTVEIINTDAEGRLVLADVMWHAQTSEAPAAMIDLATLTGACIIALGHENAGVFSNDDDLCNAFLKAAETEGEGAWRLPLGPGYDKLLKSQKADMKNVGGRPAGATTAAQFLQRFVKDDMPWIHLDIAGVAQHGGETTLAPKGATGWGVMALDRLIKDRFEAP